MIYIFMEKEIPAKKYNSSTKIEKKSKIHYVKLAPKPEIKQIAKNFHSAIRSMKD